MDPNDARSMCCRLRLDTRKLEARGGGLFGANPLTGSIGVVTLNLPRIGFLAKDEADFFKRLDDVLEQARSSLEIKRKVLERYTLSGLYPYTNTICIPFTNALSSIGRITSQPSESSE